MGTLQKFCQEESRLKNKEEKKAKIERKLEEQQNQERETMKRERQCLYNNRKRQQLEIKMLENKMNLMKEFNMYEESKKPLMNFIRTKAKPYIYYLPKVLDKTTEGKLADTKRDIQSECDQKKIFIDILSFLCSYKWCLSILISMRTEQIERRRNDVNNEMAELVSRFESVAETLQSEPPIADASLNVSQDNDKARDSGSDEDNKAMIRSVVNNDVSTNSSHYKDDRPENGDQSSGEDEADDSDADRESKSINSQGALVDKRNSTLSKEAHFNNLFFSISFAVSIKIEKDDDEVKSQI